MAFGTSTHVQDCGSVANFKDWAQFVSTAFSSSGWVQASDTGQVNWSTISSVPGSNSYVYEIWKMADSLQSTYPVFVKVEYGNNGGTNNPAPRFTIGTGSSGSGTITGSATLGPTNCYTGGTSPTGSGASVFDSYWSGSTSRIGVLLWRNAATNIPLFFGIERTLDSTGAPSNEGVTLLTLCSQDNTGYVRQQTLQLAPTIAVAAQYFCPITAYPLKNPPSSLALSTNVGVAPVFPLYGKYGNVMTICMGCGGSDITENTIVAASLYGTSHNWLCVRNGGGFANFNAAASGGANGLMMRYD